MHPTRRPSCRTARSMDSPSPSTQKRRLFSRSALGMTGMHESTSIYASVSSHLVTKLHRAALVGFDLRQMKGDVSVELREEWDPITNQDRQDRIPNLVG